jgi:hypothetical protein
MATHLHRQYLKNAIFLLFPFNSSIQQQIQRPECVTCSAPFGIKIATTEHNEK